MAGALDLGIEIRTCLVEGSFPPIDDELPKSRMPDFLEFDRKELSAMIDSARKFTSDLTRRLVFMPNGKSVAIENRLPEAGEFKGTLQTTITSPEGMATFGTDPKYIARSLDVLDSELVELEVGKRKLAMRTTDGSFIAVWVGMAAD